MVVLRKGDDAFPDEPTGEDGEALPRHQQAARLGGALVLLGMFVNIVSPPAATGLLVLGGLSLAVAALGWVTTGR